MMPVYNEQQTIRSILARVRAAPLDVEFERLQREGDNDIRSIQTIHLEREIVVVDDGSTDGTRDLLRLEEQKGDIRLIFHERNRGKGAAIRTAIEHATGDILLIQDADLEYDSRDYPALLQPILEGNAKVVYGSRFLGGTRKTMLFWHSVGNRFLTFLTNLLYDTTLSDMETCYKVFEVDVIQGISLRSNRFDFEPEFTAKVLKRGHRIYEVPISYSGREFEEGKKITWRDGVVALWTLLKYRFVD